MCNNRLISANTLTLRAATNRSSAAVHLTRVHQTAGEVTQHSCVSEWCLSGRKRAGKERKKKRETRWRLTVTHKVVGAVFVLLLFLFLTLAAKQTNKQTNTSGSCCNSPDLDHPSVLSCLLFIVYWWLQRCDREDFPIGPRLPQHRTIPSCFLVSLVIITLEDNGTR